MAGGFRACRGLLFLAKPVDPGSGINSDSWVVWLLDGLHQTTQRVGPERSTDLRKSGTRLGAATFDGRFATKPGKAPMHSGVSPSVSRIHDLDVANLADNLPVRELIDAAQSRWTGWASRRRLSPREHRSPNVSATMNVADRAADHRPSNGGLDD